VQPGVAGVIAPIVGVLAAIGLDDQPGFEADEVDDVRADRLLPLEFPTDPFCPQQRLQAILSVGRGCPAW
jgi:hypothetical protein